MGSLAALPIDRAVIPFVPTLAVIIISNGESPNCFDQSSASAAAGRMRRARAFSLLETVTVLNCYTLPYVVLWERLLE